VVGVKRARVEVEEGQSLRKTRLEREVGRAKRQKTPYQPSDIGGMGRVGDKKTSVFAVVLIDNLQIRVTVQGAL
jgi:hypothetical protein